MRDHGAAGPETGVSLAASTRHRHLFTLRVYYEDTDAGGIVYYANYLRFLERARTEALREWGAGVAELVTKGFWFVVTESAMKLHAPARYDDVLTISTRLAELRRASFRLKHEVKRGETLLVTASTLMACVNPSLRPARIPEEALAALTARAEG